MPEQSISCPKCRHEFQLTAAISGTIEEKFRKQFDAETQRREDEFKKRAEFLEAQKAALETAQKDQDAKLAARLKVEREKLAAEAQQHARDEMNVALADMKARLQDQDARLKKAQTAELDFLKKQRELDDARASFELDATRKLEAQFKQRLAAEQEKIKAGATAQIRESLGVEMNDLKQQLAEKEQRIKAAQASELDFRKKQRELQEQQESLALENQRKLDEERERIKQEVAARAAEEFRFKELESAKKINDMRAQIDALKQKAEQASQQTQGEVLELELESILKAAFPHDRIEPVSKGVRGADVLQRVLNSGGKDCGSILWETKRTKSWSDGWIPKLKEDKLNAKADVAVLMTAALPKDCNHFDVVDEVVVTNFACARSVATMLRVKLLEAAQNTVAMNGKQGKMELLYNYLCGQEFRQRVNTIVDAFDTMKAALEQEKRAMTKLWSAREKQLERVIQSTAAMHGDMQGIIGSSLPQIESLELGHLPLGAAAEDEDA